MVSGTNKLVVYYVLYLQVGAVEELGQLLVRVLDSVGVLPSVFGAPTMYQCGNSSEQDGTYLGGRGRIRVSTKAHLSHQLKVEVQLPY